MCKTDANSNNSTPRKRKRIPVNTNRVPAIPDSPKSKSTNTLAKARTAGPVAAGPAVPAGSPVLPGKQARPQCRFEMFVVLKTGIVSYFPAQNRTFCYRGDKYTAEEGKMLHKLVSHYANKRHEFFHMELYDNSLPREGGQRLIYKIRGGRVYLNRLDEYSDYLVNTNVPEELKLFP